MIACLVIWLVILVLVGGEEASRAGFDTEEKVGLGPNDWYDRGVALHREQNDEQAIQAFKRATELEPENAEYWFSLGVSQIAAGQAIEGGDSYYMALQKDETHIKSLLNLAAVHHKYGSVEDSLPFYEGLQPLMMRGVPVNVEHYLMNVHNLCVAYMQAGKYEEAYRALRDFRSFRAQLLDAGTCDASNTLRYNEYDCNGLMQAKYSNAFTLLNVMRSSVDFNGVDEIAEELLQVSLENIGANNNFIPLLPFHAFNMDISLKKLQALAEGWSNSDAILVRDDDVLFERCALNSLRRLKLEQRIGSVPKLKLGFISFDFNDHPTAHLVEAIFASVQKDPALSTRVQLGTYSYGRDDGSIYRREIVRLSDPFRDITQLGFQDAAGVICDDDVHILVEMQMHTIGNRLEITARRPAPVAMNYLIYPGTGGATFMDTIAADAVVVPPEHAPFYTEKLILLPPTYQISFYDREGPQKTEWTVSERDQRELRAKYGLPTEKGAVVLCNFNKIDKLNLRSLSFWLNIMVRVPQSYLWLLLPGGSKEPRGGIDGTQQNRLSQERLGRYAEIHGVSASRILFAPRVGKTDHIERHAAADLFVDSLTYGAHSTATDSLRGGLPVLTVVGSNFPARVAASLYASFGPDTSLNRMLVSNSVRDAEETAVRLLRQIHLIRKLKYELAGLITSSAGLFNTDRAVRFFLAGTAATLEARALQSASTPGTDTRPLRYHLVVAPDMSGSIESAE